MRPPDAPRRRWVGARRLEPLGWGAFVLLLAAAVVWRAAHLRTEYARGLHATHALTVRTLMLQAAAWARARGAHAETVAALLADDVARGSAAVGPRFTRAMTVLAAQEGFVGGRVLDAGGRRIAGDAPATARPPGDAAAPVRVAEARGSVSPEPRGATAVRCGAGFCAEFHAPVRADGRVVGTVVLVAPVDDSTFQPLNASRPGVRTLRTTMLAPLAAADGRDGATTTLAVVASLGGRGAPEPPPTLAPAALPAHVRRALTAPPGRLHVDSARGLAGRPVHYAVVRVPDLDWVLLREFEHAELLAGVREHLLMEEPIFVALALSLAGLGRYGWRARRARREQELTRLRADFVASTSHELRTPLTQIRMFAELLQKDALRGPEESARALRIIEKEASRLTILVDNLLNYTRLRRRAEDTALAAIPPADVAEAATQVIEAFAPLAAERRASVVSYVPAGLRVRMDALALRQVLTNFLENAVKYGPDGQTVVIGATAERGRVRFWVDDQGPGVPPAERAAVWEAFRRGRHAERSAAGGSGIGLAVVRELVLQWEGDVTVEEASGGGARFVVTLPEAPADD